MNIASTIRCRGWSYLAVLIVFFCPFVSASAEDVANESKFESLFDGKTLNGWEGKSEFFRVVDNAIVAGSLERKIPQNEFLCTQKKYADFELQLEVKLIGKGQNAGVQFRSSRIPNDNEVRGYQADAGKAWNRSVWGALYDESRRRKMLAEGEKSLVSKITKDGQWNHLRVRAQGSRIQIFLNGKQTVDYVEKDEGIAGNGIIGLQIHSGPPTEAWYRNIKIRTLPSKPGK